MVYARCREIYRNSSKKITGYLLIGGDGIPKRVTPEQLKSAITNNLIRVSNLKITSDGRIVQYNDTLGDMLKITNIDKIPNKINKGMGTELSKQLNESIRQLEKDNITFMMELAKYMNIGNYVNVDFERMIDDDEKHVTVTYFVATYKKLDFGETKIDIDIDTFNKYASIMFYKKALNSNKLYYDFKITSDLDSAKYMANILDDLLVRNKINSDMYIRINKNRAIIIKESYTICRSKALEFMIKNPSIAKLVNDKKLPEIELYKLAYRGNPGILHMLNKGTV